MAKHTLFLIIKCNRRGTLFDSETLLFFLPYILLYVNMYGGVFLIKTVVIIVELLLFSDP